MKFSNNSYFISFPFWVLFGCLTETFVVLAEKRRRKQAGMKEENRQYSRVPLEVPFRVSLPDGTLYEYQNFEDISLGGCQIRSKKEFEMYSDCLIEILPSSIRPEKQSAIQIVAKIMRIGYDCTGIMFVRVGNEGFHELQNLLQTKESVSQSLEQ